MTCFWDGITTALLKQQIIPNNSPRNAHSLIKYLKENNKKTINVTWNDEKLTQKQLQENYDHINEIKSETINHGYDCSTFDPFLFLIAEHFQVDIIHKYCNSPIKYTYIPTVDCKIIYDKQISKVKKTLTVASNRSHFWAT